MSGIHTQIGSGGGDRTDSKQVSTGAESAGWSAAIIAPKCKDLVQSQLAPPDVDAAREILRKDEVTEEVFFAIDRLSGKPVSNGGGYARSRLELEAKMRPLKCGDDYYAHPVAPTS